MIKITVHSDNPDEVLRIRKQHRNRAKGIKKIIDKFTKAYKARIMN